VVSPPAAIPLNARPEPPATPTAAIQDQAIAYAPFDASGGNDRIVRVELVGSDADRDREVVTAASDGKLVVFVAKSCFGRWSRGDASELWGNDCQDEMWTFGVDELSARPVDLGGLSGLGPVSVNAGQIRVVTPAGVLQRSSGSAAKWELIARNPWKDAGQRMVSVCSLGSAGFVGVDPADPRQTIALPWKSTEWLDVGKPVTPRSKVLDEIKCGPRDAVRVSPVVIDSPSTVVLVGINDVREMADPMAGAVNPLRTFDYLTGEYWTGDDNKLFRLALDGTEFVEVSGVSVSGDVKAGDRSISVRGGPDGTISAEWRPTSLG
jgi:hypothetical protein